VTLRPFNTYGPRQSARAVIPTIITQALTQDIIYLGNLDATRDLTFVSDTVEGFLCAGQTEGIEGRTFNLGVGHEVKIGELANEIISLVGRDVEIRVDTTRLRPSKSEVQRLLSDNRLAKDILNWSPRVTLRDGLSKTIKWISDNLSLYRPHTYQL
jgi:dTDP-glucose 4,6-dehydratase